MFIRMDNMPHRPGPVRSPGEVPPGSPGSAEVAYARMLMANLEVAMDHRRLTIRDVAKLAGLSHGTVHNVLKAKGWVDLRTVARLEAALGEPLIDDWDERRW